METKKFLGLSFLLTVISMTCFVNSSYSEELTRNRFNSLNDPSGWGSIQFWGGGTIVPSDSLEGGTMLQITFPAGIADGGEPARLWYNASSTISEAYIQFYHKFGSDFTFHPIANKLVYFYSDGDRDSHAVFILMYGSNMAFEVYGTNMGNAPYYTNHGPSLGVWYKYGIHTKVNSSPGSHDGILQVWVNDVMKINRSDVMYFGPGTTVTGWKDIDLAPAYGGAGGPNPVVGHTYYDDFVISTTPPISGNITSSRIPSSPMKLQIQ